MNIVNQWMLLWTNVFNTKVAILKKPSNLKTALRDRIQTIPILQEF